MEEDEVVEEKGRHWLAKNAKTLDAASGAETPALM
jgi:hypothetical protein